MSKPPATHSPPAPVIFVLEPDDFARDSLCGLIESIGWAARIFDRAEACLDALPRGSADCIICDVDHPEGIRLAEELIRQHSDTPCVAISERDDSLLTKQVIFLGSFTGRWELTRRSDPRHLRLAIVESLLSWLRHPSRRLLNGIVAPPPVLDPDFRERLRNHSSNDLILAPDLTVAAMSDRYAASTMLDPTNCFGRLLFDVFPDNPDDPDATGTSHLGASLQRASVTHLVDRMPLQRYDIRTLNGTGPFEERWWYPVNFPVLQDGELHHFVHRVEDVTRFVRLQ